MASEAAAARAAPGSVAAAAASVPAADVHMSTRRATGHGDAGTAGVVVVAAVVAARTLHLGAAASIEARRNHPAEPHALHARCDAAQSLTAAALPVAAAATTPVVVGMVGGQGRRQANGAADGRGGGGFEERTPRAGLAESKPCAAGCGVARARSESPSTSFVSIVRFVTGQGLPDRHTPCSRQHGETRRRVFPRDATLARSNSSTTLLMHWWNPSNHKFMLSRDDAWRTYSRLSSSTRWNWNVSSCQTQPRQHGNH